MKKAIVDEFTNLKISRQRKYQLRQHRDNRCTICGESTPGASRCLKHLVLSRERQRKKLGLKRRYHGTLSYRLEAQSSKSQRLPAESAHPGHSIVDLVAYSPLIATAGARSVVEQKVPEEESRNLSA